MTSEIDLPYALAEVQAAFGRYERALQADDIAAREALFCHRTATTRYGVGENLRGWQAIPDFRRSGKLRRFSGTLINSLVVTHGCSFATANTECQREGEGTTGRETKALVRMPDGWRIVLAHARLLGMTD